MSTVHIVNQCLRPYCKCCMHIPQPRKTRRKIVINKDEYICVFWNLFLHLFFLCGADPWLDWILWSMSLLSEKKRDMKGETSDYQQDWAGYSKYCHTVIDNWLSHISHGSLWNKTTLMIYNCMSIENQEMIEHLNKFLLVILVKLGKISFFFIINDFL